jgi:hypothetical protein
MTVIPFPLGPTAATIGATRLQIWKERLREGLGVALNRLRLPGTISPGLIEDALSGDRIEIRVGPLLTRISVNGRDYYFDRISGAPAGTGSGCS